MILAIAQALLLPLVLAAITGGTLGYSGWMEHRRGKREERGLKRQLSVEKQAALIAQLLQKKELSGKRQQLVQNLEALRRLQTEDRETELNTRITALRRGRTEDELAVMAQILQGGEKTGQTLQAGIHNINMPLSWYLQQI